MISNILYSPNPRTKIFQRSLKDLALNPLELEIQEFSEKVNVFDIKFQVSDDYLFCFMLYYTLEDMKSYNTIVSSSGSTKKD